MTLYMLLSCRKVSWSFSSYSEDKIRKLKKKRIRKLKKQKYIKKIKKNKNKVKIKLQIFHSWAEGVNMLYAWTIKKQEWN